MNKREWEERVAALKKELADLEANPPKREPGERWEPKYGEQYWVVNMRCELIYQIWGDSGYDIKSSNNFNIFQTREEAEFARERTKVMRELDTWATDGLLPPNEIYGIVCDSSGELGVFLWAYKYSPHVFESREVAKKAIEAIGEERLKNIISG